MEKIIVSHFRSLIADHLFHFYHYFEAIDTILI